MAHRMRRWCALAAFTVAGTIVALPFATGSTEGGNPATRLVVGNVASDSLPTVVPFSFDAGLTGECKTFDDIPVAVGPILASYHEHGRVQSRTDDSLVLFFDTITDGQVEKVTVVITLVDGPAAGTIFRRELSKSPDLGWLGQPTLTAPGLGQTTRMKVAFCYKKGTPPPAPQITFASDNSVHIDAPANIPPNSVVTGNLLLLPSGADEVLFGVDELLLAIKDGNPIAGPVTGLINNQDVRRGFAMAIENAHPFLPLPQVDLIDVLDTGDNSNTVTLGVTSPGHLNHPILQFGTTPVALNEHFNPYQTVYIRLNKVPDALTTPSSLGLTGGGGASDRDPIDYLVLDPLWEWDVQGNLYFAVNACNPLQQTVIVNNNIDVPLLSDDELAGLFTGHVAGTVPGGRCLQMTLAESVIAFYNGHVPDDFQVPANATQADIDEIVLRTGAKPPNLR
ncbi:MAG: hypothetical protein AB7N24_08475 [Dehalococcoidia bacterium]